MYKRKNRKPGRKRTALGDRRDRVLSVYIPDPAFAARVKAHPGSRSVSEFAVKAFADALAKHGG